MSEILQKLSLLLFLSFSLGVINLHALSFDEYVKNPFGNVMFLRHADAPGFGDPENFKIGQCDTQRNLGKEGREQAKQLGGKFRAAGFVFNKIYSSQWCRCVDTARLLRLGEVLEFAGLNSFFQDFSDKDEVLNKLHSFLENEVSWYLYIELVNTILLT